jgi:hypothetical protein
VAFEGDQITAPPQMKHAAAMAFSIFAALLLASCASHSPAARKSAQAAPQWPAFNLAADGKFADARQAVERGRDTRRHYNEGADYYMMRTLSPKLYDRWKGNRIASDAADVFGTNPSLEFWAKRENL